MKGLYTLLPLAGLAFLSFWFVNRSQTGFFIEKEPKNNLRLPGGENEENREVREAWERLRLADPATGQIPEGISFQERWFAKGLPVADAALRSGPDWTARGPWNYGGRTRGLAIDVTNENRLMAGGVSGGLWLSNDGGQSWARKTPLNAHPGCISIAQDVRPGHTNTWYYLSGEIYGTSASGGGSFYLGDGLFKSTDNGETWTPVASTDDGNPQDFSSAFQGGWRVVTSPTDSLDVVYLATIGTIYRSANGGTSWTAVRGGDLSNYSYFTDVAVTSTGVLYATLSNDGPQKGIWRSTNGTNWTNITPANFPPVYDRVVIGINPNNENEVYFLGSTPGYGLYNAYLGSDDWTSFWKYTYVSGNGAGANGTWENLSGNLPSTGTEFDQFACQGGYDLVVKVQPGTNHVFIGGTNIYRSTDGFSTPNNTTQIGGYKIGTFLPFFELYPGHHPDQHDFLFLPGNPNVMITASDGGLHRTEDCNAPTVSWNSLNRGYLTTQFYTALIDHNAPGDNMLMGGLQDNGNFFVNSDNPAAPWRQTVNGDGSFGAVAPNKAYYILSIQQGRVAKCTLDAAGNVLAFRRIDPIGPVKDDYLFINPLTLDPNDANILYLPAGRKVYRQDDLAAISLTGEWDSISQGWVQFPDTLTLAQGSFTAIAISQSNPAHRMYLGTSNNKLFKVDNANTGQPTFTAITPPLAGTAGYINCITVDPDNADDVVIIYSNYKVYSMFRSLNGGQSWLKVGGNLEGSVGGTGAGPSLRWLSILPYPNGTKKYFCGTSVGLFSADTLKLHASAQPGTLWTLEGPTSIGSTVVNYVDTRASDGLVVAASHGNGMFSANFLQNSSQNQPVQQKSVRVSPNPASQFVEFDVLGGLDHDISIRLFNLEGRQVRQIQTSNSKQRLEISDLPNGVYLYSIQGAGWSKTGKLVVAH